jgi:tetratricopeptide (TPR) repeat protein
MQFQYGVLLRQIGQLDEAETHLYESCLHSPQATEYLFELAQLYVQQQRWDRARKIAEGLVRMAPGVAEFHQLLDATKRQ